MEDSRLNINKPLLSVRRFSSILDSRKNENRKNEGHLPIMPSQEPSNTLSISDPMMETGSVPFGWEHSPGRPKNKQVQAKENSPCFPKLPPGRFFKHVKKDLDTNIAKSVGSSKKGSSDGSDEAYVDALDTLSRGDTSFFNCSASGVSGNGSNMKPSGNLPADPKMRDYMMGRFLPAAKAMASDVHVSQHTFRKNVVKEKPPEVKKIVNVDLNKLQLRYGPNFVDHEKEDDDETDSDNDSNQHRNISSKFCGLIPRFCSVNPVHGMCVRARLPISPANRTQASSSSVSSFSETDNDPARNATYKHRSLNSVLETASTEARNIEGSKLYNCLQGPSVSVSKSFPSCVTVSEQSSSSPKKKGLSFKELLTDINTNKIETETETEKDSNDSMVEKTLYVDSIQTVKSPKEHSHSSFNESLESDLLGDDSKQNMKKGNRKDSEGDKDLKSFQDEGFDFKSPTPPPLPKSPSDSWLYRNLPSVSSKNAAARWNPKSPSTNTGATDPKSKQDQDNQLLHKKGPLNPIPES